MSRSLITLHSDAQRKQAKLWIDKAQNGTRVEFKAAKRTMPQNSRMWAMLTEVSVQVKWHGVTLKAWEWKEIFLHALKRELRMVLGLDGETILLGRASSSDLTISEMSDMIELIFKFGAEHGVVFARDEAA